VESYFDSASMLMQLGVMLNNHAGGWRKLKTQ
jgi:hypothetical protein